MTQQSFSSPDPTGYHVDESPLLNLSKDSICPFTLVESLMREVNERGCVQDVYQSEELIGCLAVLHAKKREWDDFQQLIGHIASPGVLINALIQGFVPAEQQLKEGKDISGVSCLLHHTGKILSLLEKKIPAEGGYLLHKCFEYLTIIEGMNDEDLNTMMAENKRSLPQAMWDTLAGIKSYIFSDSDMLSEGEFASLRHIEESGIEDDFFTTSILPEKITQILGNLPYLRSASPIDAQMFMEDFLELIQKLPQWAEHQIKERENDEEFENAREEFITENLSLLSTLVDMAREFVAQEKFDNAFLVLNATLEMIPVKTFEIDGEEVIHHILGGIDLLASLMFEKEKSSRAKGLLDQVIDRINATIESLPHNDLSYHVDFFSHFASGMDLTWQCIQSIKESYGLPYGNNSDLKELNCVYLAYERIERLLNEQQIALLLSEESYSESNSDTSPSLLEPLTTICYRMSAFSEYLGHIEHTDTFRKKFKLLTLRLIQNSGISFTEEMDENGPTTNYLDFVEELVYRGELDKARELAEGFYTCYFEFDSSLKLCHLQQSETSDDHLSYGPSDSGILKRFMMLCAEAGFTLMAVDVYRKLNQRICDHELKFLHLVDLLNSLRV